MATPPYPGNYGKGSEPTAPPPGPGGYGYGPQPPAYGQGMPPPQQQQQPGYYQPPPQQPGYYQPQQQQQQPAYYQPPPAGKVQHQQKAQSSHGLLGSLGNIGRDVAKTLNSAATDAATMYSKSVHGDIVSQLQTGATVVLISRMSGRSLEIVQGSDGRLIVDAACADSPHVFNNKWSVTKLPSGFYLFSNYNNYLAIEGGQLFLAIGISNPAAAPPSAQFKLSQSEHFLMLESGLSRGQYVAANERGEVKPPVATSNDKFSQFGVLICSYQGGPR